jgi:hypothetical protein
MCLGLAYAYATQWIVSGLIGFIGMRVFLSLRSDSAFTFPHLGVVILVGAALAATSATLMYFLPLPTCP